MSALFKRRNVAIIAKGVSHASSEMDIVGGNSPSVMVAPTPAPVSTYGREVDRWKKEQERGGCTAKSNDLVRWK
jgi:hypothetical protein